MPFNKNRNNKSHKSTSSTSSNTTSSLKSKEDDGFSSILKMPAPSSRRTTPTSIPSPQTPVSPPPPPPPTPWDSLGMTEQDFLAMQQRVFQQTREYEREIYIENMLRDLTSPSYWERRIESLEKEREYFNKKRGWSAVEIECVERIDAEIQECKDEIDRIYDEQDRIEYEYD